MRIRSPFKNLFPTRRTKRTKKSRAALKAACLSLGLATAWGASDAAADTIINLEVSPTSDLAQAYAVYFHTNTSGTNSAILLDLGQLQGGQTTEFQHSFTFFDPIHVLNPNGGYVVFGTHDQSGEPGITHSFPDDTHIQNSTPWENIFTSHTDLAAAADLIENGTSSQVRSFANQYDHLTRTAFNEIAILIDFPGSSDGGTALATLVPEPATFSLLVLATGIIALGRRR